MGAEPEATPRPYKDCDFPILRPLRPCSTACDEGPPELGDPYDLSNFIVLVDDPLRYSRADIGKFVPVTATYTVCRLRHKLPGHWVGAAELHSFMWDMIESYRELSRAIKDELKIPSYSPIQPSRVTVGVIDLCLHTSLAANRLVAADKQAILAYLLTELRGDMKRAWEIMLEWMGADEDHWNNLNDLFIAWVLPSIQYNYSTVSTVSGWSASADDEDSGIDCISQYDYESDSSIDY